MYGICRFENPGTTVARFVSNDPANGGGRHLSPEAIIRSKGIDMSHLGQTKKHTKDALNRAYHCLIASQIWNLSKDLVVASLNLVQFYKRHTREMRVNKLAGSSRIINFGDDRIGCVPPLKLPVSLHMNYNRYWKIISFWCFFTGCVQNQKLATGMRS